MAVRYIWECTNCGELFTEPRREHRHAEGPAALGVYYPVERLTVEVVERADVAYIDHEWVHTPSTALHGTQNRNDDG